MSNAIQTIGAKHSLHIDQIGELEAETAAAMMGVSKTEDLEENITNTLGLDPQKATAITKDINEMIFKRIRENMKASVEPKVQTDAPKMPLATQIPTSVPVSITSTATPLSPKQPLPPTQAPSATPAAAPISPSTPTPTPKPAATPNLASADAILSEKKVTPPAGAPVAAPIATSAASPAPKVDPAQPQNYKADPYREPIQ